MLCPTCKTPLTMSERQGIEIDYCPTCRGVWLDRGELDKIIERSAAGQPVAPPPAGGAMPQQHFGDMGFGGQPQGYEKPHRKKRKSFLEELFD